jgi:hypothetical protein
MVDFDFSGEPPLVCSPLSPFVALLNDKEFRSLLRATKAARLGRRLLFEKSNTKTF